MVRAEKELTENLKHTHQQIDEQLNMLREQLQVWGNGVGGGLIVVCVSMNIFTPIFLQQERQKRIHSNRRKQELLQQVSLLTSTLDTYKLAMVELELNKGPSGSSSVGGHHEHVKQVSLP
jgi:hypothetical protein